MTPAERVAYGATQLDSHIPLWFTVIEPPSPEDMMSCFDCVAGQLMYLDGETAASIGIPHDPRTDRPVLPAAVFKLDAEWGFDALQENGAELPYNQQFAELSEAWVAEIVARREEAA